MPKQKEQVQSSQVIVTSQFLRKGEAQGAPLVKDELIRVHKYVTEPARVTVEYGMTLSLGNYESARLGVAVSIPCYFEEMDTAYKFASKWAEERINSEKESIRKAVLSSAGDLE
jgi:hypothetical protein